MKVCYTTTLTLPLFCSWSILGSLALRGSNSRNNMGVKRVLVKEDKTIEEDDLLRFHMMIKEEENEPVNDLPLLTKQTNLKRMEKKESPSAHGKSIPVHRIMKTIDIDTMKADVAIHRHLQATCDAELAILQNCYASDSDCDLSCIVAVEDKLFEDNNNIVPCDQYNAALCPSFAACGCETCVLDYSDYYNCLPNITCTFDCGSTPSPTPAPTAQPICPDELDRVATCVQNMDSCVTCIDNAYSAIFENADTVACEEFEAGICPAIETNCDCGECSELWQEYYSCVSTEGGCTSFDCTLDPTPSPTESTPSPASPEPSETKAPTGNSPGNTDTDSQSSEDGGGISIGVIIGAIGGIVLVVGFIVVAVLHSRRKRSNSKPEKPVLGSPMDTSHGETEYNTPSTPGRHSHNGTSSGSPVSSAYNSATSPNATDANQGLTPTPVYKEPYPSQPSTSYRTEDQHQHRPSQQYPPQQKDIRSSYSAYSSSSSSQTTPSKQPHHNQQQQQQQQLPPRPSPAYLPTNKDQCRTVLHPRGGDEEIVVEATPVMMVESTPVMANVHSVASNHVDTASSNDSQSRRPALDP